MNRRSEISKVTDFWFALGPRCPLTPRPRQLTPRNAFPHGAPPAAPAGVRVHPRAHAWSLGQCASGRVACLSDAMCGAGDRCIDPLRLGARLRSVAPREDAVTVYPHLAVDGDGYAVLHGGAAARLELRAASWARVAFGPRVDLAVLPTAPPGVLLPHSSVGADVLFKFGWF